MSFVLSLDDFTEGRLRYSNSDVTETVDFVFKLSLERGETSVTLMGILRYVLCVCISETLVHCSGTVCDRGHVAGRRVGEQLRNCVWPEPGARR